MTGSPTKTICFFNSNRAWGGGEKWHFSMARELNRLGYKTILVTNQSSALYLKASQERLNTYAFRISSLSFLNPLKILLLFFFFKSKNVQTVIMNLPADLKCAGLAAKLARVKNIIYRRGMPHPLRGTWLNRFLFQKILTRVIVNSEEIGRSLRQNNEDWFPSDKIKLIYNGMDPQTTYDHSKKMIIKKDQEFIIGNAGRLTTQKGQKYLIELAKELKQRKFAFQLIIAGEGELREELAKMIAQYHLEQEVTLLGHVNDMASFMNSIDLFIFPSLFEGAANTLIETLFYQKPIIAFDISSNPEIIEHGKNGFLAKAFDVNELLQYVIELKNSPEKRTLFAEEGLRSIQEKFNSKKLLQQLIEII